LQSKELDMEKSIPLMGRALPAALNTLCVARCSGLVTVTSEPNYATIMLDTGRIMWATSNATQRLGDALVERGLLSQESLDGALSMQRRKREHTPLATILLELGLLSPEVADHQLAEQTTDVFVEVLSWQEGTLRIEPIPPDQGKSLGKGQDVETLLMRTSLIRAGFGEASREVRPDGTVAVA
jgi:hypothetical protein